MHWTANAGKRVPIGVYILLDLRWRRLRLLTLSRRTLSPTECPDSASTLATTPRHVCIYETSIVNLSEVRACDPTTDSCSGASRYGAAVVVLSAASGLGGTMGTWAVTAP